MNLKGMAAVMSAAMAALFSCSRPGGENEISASGTIEAVEVNVSSRVSGNLIKLYVDEGSRVESGDTLAEIDHTIYDLQLAQAQANLEMARAQFKVIRSNYESTLKLLRQGTGTEKQKEELEARYQAGRAQVEGAQATAALAGQMIGYCHVSSPVSGVVTHKLVEVGELVTPGAAVVTVSQLDKVKLTIYVTEQELGRVKVGQRAEVMIDAYPDRKFLGAVIFVSPVAEFTPKNIQTREERVKLVFAVKIEIQNPEGIFKAGMPADAVVKTGGAPG